MPRSDRNLQQMFPAVGRVPEPEAGDHRVGNAALLDAVRARALAAGLVGEHVRVKGGGEFIEFQQTLAMGVDSPD